MNYFGGYYASIQLEFVDKWCEYE